MTSILTTPLALLGHRPLRRERPGVDRRAAAHGLGYAYPFLALNFILVALVSWLILGEPMPALRWLGIGFICVGIVVVAQAGV